MAALKRDERPTCVEEWTRGRVSPRALTPRTGRQQCDRAAHRRSSELIEQPSRQPVKQRRPCHDVVRAEAGDPRLTCHTGSVGSLALRAGEALVLKHPAKHEVSADVPVHEKTTAHGTRATHTHSHNRVSGITHAQCAHSSTVSGVSLSLWCVATSQKTTSSAPTRRNSVR